MYKYLIELPTPKSNGLPTKKNKIKKNNKKPKPKNKQTNNPHIKN